MKNTNMIADLAAIKILGLLCQEIDEDPTLNDAKAITRSDILRRAIRHLSLRIA